MNCEVLIDWLTFSVKNVEDPRQVITDWLGMDPDLFQDPGFGLLSFEKDLSFGDIHVLYQPRQNDPFNASGVCVSMSGNGCRSFETTSKLSSGEESPFIKLFEHISCEPYNTNVSRIDVACDDHSGVLDMDVLIQKTNDNDINSRMLDRQVVNRYKGKSRSGSTVYIGSPSSDFRIRIYDKALEQGLHDQHWIRVELVLRSSHAKSFVDLVVNYAEIGKLAAEILNDKLSFIDRDDSNISRCTVCYWWLDFVEELESVHLVSRKVVEHVVSRIDGWIQHQIGPSLCLLSATLGVEHIYDVIRASASRLSDKQLALIRDFNCMREALGGFHWDNSSLPEEYA